MIILYSQDAELRKNTGLSGPILKKKLVREIYRYINPVTGGFFSDESWQGVRRVWQSLNKLGLDWNMTDTYYGSGHYDGEFPKKSKIWKFEVHFTNQNGRPDTIYGNVTASGNGPVADPLLRYDVNVVMSSSNSAIKTAKTKGMKTIQSSKITEILEHGGKSKDQENNRYDPRQLSMGKSVEQEHVEKNPNLSRKEKDDIAEKISRDHLEEAKDFADGKGGKYYDLLGDLEKTVKKRVENKAESHMKIIQSKKYIEAKKKGKKKDWGPNPWAVCHTTVDKDKEPEKFERCVQDVKKKQSNSEPPIFLEAKKKDGWPKDLKKGRFTEWCKRNGFDGPSKSCADKALKSDDKSVRGMASFYLNTVKP